MNPVRSKNYSTKVPAGFEILVRRPLFLSLLSKISCVVGLGKKGDEEKSSNGEGKVFQSPSRQVFQAPLHRGTDHNH